MGASASSFATPAGIVLTFEDNVITEGTTIDGIGEGNGYTVRKYRERDVEQQCVLQP